MRILFLIRALTTGGAQRQMIALANGLQARGHSVHVVVYYGKSTLEQYLSSDIRLISLGKKHRYDFLSFTRRLIHQINLTQPDIIYSFLVTSNNLSILLKPKFKTIKHVIGIRSSVIPLSKKDFFSYLNYFLEPLLANFSDLIIINSKSGYAHIIHNGYPEKKTIIIPNGIDTQYFIPDKKIRTQFRTEFLIDEQAIVIGLVGRLDPLKDHATFFNAAINLIAENPNLEFLIVGHGERKYREKLVSLSRSLGLEKKLHWIANYEYMPAVYNALDLLCSTSISEGMPNVIAEAMACGVPCVVTNVGDSALLVGDTGMVLPPNDSYALAIAVSHIIQKLHLIDHSMIRKRIEENYSLELLIDRTEQALIQLL